MHNYSEHGLPSAIPFTACGDKKVKRVTVHLCEVVMLLREAGQGSRQGEWGSRGTYEDRGECGLNDRIYGGLQSGVGVGPVTCK